MLSLKLPFGYGLYIWLKDFTRIDENISSWHKPYAIIEYYFGKRLEEKTKCVR